jgi:hypothetical protein
LVLEEHDLDGAVRDAGADVEIDRQTLQVPEFVLELDVLDVTRADGYLLRGDFSRWIADIFGDRALARELEGHERGYLQSGSQDAVSGIAAAIKARYELTVENEVAGV